MLDDMRASLFKAQDEGLKKLEEDKKKLRDEFKAKKERAQHFNQGGLWAKETTIGGSR